MKSSIVLLSLALLATGLLASSGDRAWSEDDATVAPAGVWVFDVRVVRVDLASPEVTESPVPWETSSPMVSMPWTDVLAHLKSRGTTTLLLDQRGTSVWNEPLSLVQTHDVQIRAFQSQDVSNERWGSSTLTFGCAANLAPLGGKHLQYDIEAKWLIDRVKPSERPIVSMTRWKGTTPPLAGKTLGLSYREQVEVLGEARRGFEIHAFVTGRFVP